VALQQGFAIGEMGIEKWAKVIRAANIKPE
jgi:hypothetical protein